MGRRARVGALERRLKVAQAWAAYQGSTGPAAGTEVRTRRRETVGYTPLFAAANTLYEVEASVNAITKFGGAVELHLTVLGGSTTAIPAPRGFHPSMVHLALKQATGVRVTSKVSQETYIRYQAGEPFSPGNAQQNFNAPISSADGTALGLLTAFGAIQTSIGAANPGARLWLTSERVADRVTEPIA